MLVNSGSEANDLAWRIATGGHRKRRRARHRLRLPRRHRRDRRHVAGGVGGRLPARVRRARRRHWTAPPPARPIGRLHDRGAGARRDRSSTPGSPATASWIPAPAQMWPPSPTRCTRPAAWWWPTRCRPATAAPAEHLWSFQRYGLRPTSSRWASRWETAIRWRRCVTRTRSGRAVRRHDRVLQHLRRQPGGGSGRRSPCST